MYDVRLERIRTSLEREGFSTLSFNYRSVKTALDDSRYHFRFARERHRAVIVLGYSFGSVIASNICGDGLVLISPLKSVNGYSLKDCKVSKLVVIAKMDKIVPFEESMKIVEFLSDPKEVIVLETDHFYTGKFDELAKGVVKFVKKLTESFI